MKLLTTMFAGLLLALSAAARAEEPVDINAATAEMLAEAIDGVGMRKAEAIVRYREQHGPFASVDDLVEVSGIGPKTLERNRENLIAGAVTRPSLSA